MSATLPETVAPEEAARAFLRAVHEVHEGLANRVEARTLDPLHNAFVAAAEKHAALCRLVEPADDGRLPDSPGRAIARYRAGVCERVLRPVVERIEEVQPGSAVGAAWQEARARFAAIAEDVPERLEGPEPDGLYERTLDDHLTDRIRKAAVRWSRRVSAALGRPVRPGLQDVPFRTLVSWHLDGRVPVQQAALLEALSREAASRVALVHRAFDDWAPAVLHAEVVTDDASLHRPMDAPERGGDEEAESAFQLARDAATSLQAALERAASAEPDPSVEDALLSLGGAEEPFLEDVRRAGSIVARHHGSSAERRQKAVRSVDRRLDLWAAWHERVLGSLRSIGSVLHFRLMSNEVLAGLNGAAGDAARSLTARLGATARTLRATRNELGADCDRVASGDHEAMTALLRESSDRVADIVTQGIIEPFAEQLPGVAVREALERRLAELFAAIDDLPEEITVQRVPADNGPPDPATGQDRSKPRALASESFDVLQLERLRQAGEALATALDTAAGESAEARTVIGFNLQAAVAELTPSDTAPPVDTTLAEEAEEEEEPPPDPMGSARELGVSGLERAAEMLERTAAEADAAVRPFTDAAFECVNEGWREIVTRFEAEDGVQDRVRDVRFLVRARFRQSTVRAAGMARSGWTYARTWTRKGWTRAEELLRIGRSAVAGERMTGEGRRATLEALAEIDHKLAELPLVYRRLFGLQAVADRLALEGRSEDIELVRTWQATWKEGLTDALIISGWPGGGMNSFFANAVATVAEGGAAVQRISLVGRLTDEAALAARLAAELDLGDPPADLDVLAERIIAHDEDFPVVGVDGLEALLFRTSADNGLLGPFLTFLSRTDSRVLWIATINRAAWSYIERVEPTPCGLVRHLPLGPLTRADLANVILGRHARSGLRLVFDEHESYSPLMHRKLRRTRTEAERQVILREDFFDRLAQACGPSIVLALFYWLRSAYVGDDEHALRVRPFTPLNFSFLASLDPAHAFALKAFLEHGTLTIEEHERVLHCTRDESRDLFASLVNLLLIERATPASASARRAIPDDVPYRIRSLVLQPVLTMLRARNLVV